MKTTWSKLFVDGEWWVVSKSAGVKRYHPKASRAEAHEFCRRKRDQEKPLTVGML